MRLRLNALGTAALIALVAAAAIATPAGAKTKTKTFSTGPTAITIPDAVSTPNSLVRGQAISDLKIPNKGTVKEVKVGMQITHPSTFDLVVSVQKGGTSNFLSVLSSGGPPDNDNFGSGSGCGGGMTVFDPRATRHLSDSSNPFDGSYLPSSDSVPLGVFNGEQLKGTWRLVVTDLFVSLPLNTPGSITCFQVTAKYKAG